MSRYTPARGYLGSWIFENETLLEVIDVISTTRTPFSF